MSHRSVTSNIKDIKEHIFKYQRLLTVWIFHMFSTKNCPLMRVTYFLQKIMNFKIFFLKKIKNTWLLEFL